MKITRKGKARSILAAGLTLMLAIGGIFGSDAGDMFGISRAAAEGSKIEIPESLDDLEALSLRLRDGDLTGFEGFRIEDAGVSFVQISTGESGLYFDFIFYEKDNQGLTEFGISQELSDGTYQGVSCVVSPGSVFGDPSISIADENTAITVVPVDNWHVVVTNFLEDTSAPLLTPEGFISESILPNIEPDDYETTYYQFIFDAEGFIVSEEVVPMDVYAELEASERYCERTLNLGEKE